MNRFVCLAYATAIALGSFAVGGLVSNSLNSPRLVGYGCIGAHGPLYANEEDDFPTCDVIRLRS